MPIVFCLTAIWISQFNNHLNSLDAIGNFYKGIIQFHLEIKIQLDLFISKFFIVFVRSFVFLFACTQQIELLSNETTGCLTLRIQSFNVHSFIMIAQVCYGPVCKFAAPCTWVLWKWTENKAWCIYNHSTRILLKHNFVWILELKVLHRVYNNISNILENWNRLA